MSIVVCEISKENIKEHWKKHKGAYIKAATTAGGLAAGSLLLQGISHLNRADYHAGRADELETQEDIARKKGNIKMANYYNTRAKVQDEKADQEKKKASLYKLGGVAVGGSSVALGTLTDIKAGKYKDLRQRLLSRLKGLRK